MIKNNNNTMICFKKITRKMNKYIKDKSEKNIKNQKLVFLKMILQVPFQKILKTI